MLSKDKENLRRWNSAKHFEKAADISYDDENEARKEQVRRWRTTKALDNGNGKLQRSCTIKKVTDLEIKFQNIDTAQVTSYEKFEGKYYFIILLEGPEQRWAVRRRYEQFYTFHLSLMDMFPEEGGKRGGVRIIPTFPGPKLFVNDQVTSQRKEALNLYIRELFKLPEKIRKSYCVVNFFVPKEDDPKKPPSEFDTLIESFSHYLATPAKRKPNQAIAVKLDEEKFLAKIVYKEDIIKLYVSKSISLFELVKICEKKFGEEVNARFIYVDEQGDDILIADEEDLSVVMKLHSPSKLMALTVENLAEI